MPTKEWKLWVPQVRTRFIAKRCRDERSVISEQVLDMEQSSEDIGQDIWTKSCRDYDETDCPCDVCAGWRKKREDSYWSHQYHDNYDYDDYEDDDDYRSYEDILQDKLRDRDDKVAELEHEVRKLLSENSRLKKEQAEHITVMTELHNRVYHLEDFIGIGGDLAYEQKRCWLQGKSQEQIESL